MNNFCLKIRFSEAQHAISEFFFKDRRFFYATFFEFVFIEPPQFLPKMKRFTSIKDCSRFSALCDLPKTFFKKFFEKFRNFFSLFLFFLLFSVGEEWFPRFMRIPSSIFWRCKIDEILTMSFYPWFSV